MHIRHLRSQQIVEYDISVVARLTGSEATSPFITSSVSSTTKKNNGLNISPYTYECIDYENVYAVGPLAGDKLVRFLQGGALACAASLFKKYHQASSNDNKTILSTTSSRLLFPVSSRVRIIR